MVVLAVDAPASAWGLIIGKGGATLKKLQADHNVKVFIPSQNERGGVTVRGSNADCEACKDAILAIVESKRGKDKRNDKKSKDAAMFPPTCHLCDGAINCVIATFVHLGSARHLQNVVEREQDLALLFQHRENSEGIEAPAPLDVEGVATMLRNDTCCALHQKLGFNVDGLLAHAVKEQARQDVARALLAEAAQLSADPNWFRVEQRAVIQWDESPAASGQTMPITKAPLLQDMVARCDATGKPPMIRVPSHLPAALPRADPNKQKLNSFISQHRYPMCPASGRLGIAVAETLGWSLDDFDFLCGTSFIKALAGDANSVKDDFYLQRFQGTICCLHVPHAAHSQNDAGHAVERLLCGTGGLFEMATKACIGKARFLITSEVDAADGETVVELKSSSTKRGKDYIDKKVALQILINGSEFVLGCALDADKANLTAVEWLPTSEALADHAPGLVAVGQRVRLLLARVRAFMDTHSGDGGDIGPIVKLTFDESKAPMLEPTSSGVEVLPQGMW